MMTTVISPPGNTGVDWAKYAEDARNLLLATSHAGPTAMRVWTAAWCQWATSAARIQEHLALQWNEIIQEPGRGTAVIDQMRKDFRDYLLFVGGIPERAVLDFAKAMEGSVAKGVPSPDQAFVQAAEAAIEATVEGFNLLETTLEAQRTTKGSRAAAAGIKDPSAAVREKISRMRAAGERLTKVSAKPAS